MNTYVAAVDLIAFLGTVGIVIGLYCSRKHLK